MSDFGRRVGYSGHNIPWSGAFVDCVFRDARIFVPSCVYSPSGLGEFSADGRLFRVPQVGDVVFFNFPTVRTELFGMPHVGIVVDTDGRKTPVQFVSVEGQVDNGVVQARRNVSDVIGFGRPVFKVWPGIDSSSQTGPVVSTSGLSLSSVGRDVVNVQLALSRLGLLDRHTPGVFDQATRLAFARWQRMSGHVGPDADGIPTPASLESLGLISGAFRIL